MLIRGSASSVMTTYAPIATGAIVPSAMSVLRAPPSTTVPVEPAQTTVNFAIMFVSSAGRAMPWLLISV